MEVDYSREIPLLSEVPKQHWVKIYKIVNLPKLSVEQRASRLEDFLTVKQLKSIKLWMEKKAGDFFGMLTDSDQEFAEEFFEKKDIEILDSVLERYDDNTKNIYQTWKKNAGLSDTKEEDKVKVVPISPGETSHLSTIESEKVVKKPGKKPKIKAPKVDQMLDEESPSSQSRKDNQRIRNIRPRNNGPGLDRNDLEIEEKNNAGFQLRPGYFDDLSPVTNILILGSTGVGKSTFINGLINYLSFGNIHEALQNRFHVLIKSAFTHTTETMQTMRIEMEPTVRVERCGLDHEEDTREGHSATQSPKSYLFKLGPPGQEKQIRIIDTPGVGDVRGAIQDQRNFTKILNFISDFEEIHAILLLLEPNKARLDLAFRYCVNELLTHLHASAAKNLIFCFTKARQTFYRPGESFVCLQTHLNKLYEKTRIKVPLDENNVFCFDNESFRFLCAMKEGARFTEKETSDFSISWNKAVEENFRMLDRIKQLYPHQVSETLSVNNVRRLIGTLARPLAEIAKNQLINMRIIDDKNAEIRECIAKNKDLRGRLVIETVNIETQELDQPITVCTHKDCVEYRALNNGGVQETIYKTECHVPCYLEGVETSVCPNPDLLKCEVFLDPDSCSECKHSWQTHMHMRYRLIQDITRTEDPMVGREVRDRDSQIATARKFIAAQEAKRDERQKEADKIQHYCAHFAAFLKKYSIIPYNDAYLEYLDHLIKEEKAKVNAGGSDEILNELQSYRSAYDQQRFIFTNETGAPLKTLVEINNMVKELETLTFSGEIVQEIQHLEILTAKKAHHHQSTAVSVNNSFIGSAFNIVARPVINAFNTVSKGVKRMIY